MASYTPYDLRFTLIDDKSSLFERQGHAENDARVCQFIRTSSRIEVSMSIKRWKRFH
jgi:hypothetical protein